jgi:hypothetical protein
MLDLRMEYDDEEVGDRKIGERDLFVKPQPLRRRVIVKATHKRRRSGRAKTCAL